MQIAPMNTPIDQTMKTMSPAARPADKADKASVETKLDTPATENTDVGREIDTLA